MCDWAYHHEALRKARVLERKREAQQKMSREQPYGGEGGLQTQPPPADMPAGYDVRRSPIDLMQDPSHVGLDRDRSELRLQDVYRDQIYPIIHPGDRMGSSAPQRGGPAPWDHSREGPVSGPSRRQVVKELGQQAKVLRNHNLVMGPMTAFNQYLEPNANYGPPRQ